jgi:hypothetical protein
MKEKCSNAGGMLELFHGFIGAFWYAWLAFIFLRMMLA